MKSTILVALLGLALSVSAKAADPFLSQFKAGKWDGKVTNSVAPELKGKKVTCMAATGKDAVTLTVKTEGAKGQEREEWKITPTKLIQTEYDANGKMTQTYAADAAPGGTGTQKTYNIHCTAGKCDAGIPPTNQWILSVNGNKFDYVVLRDKAERHHFEFQAK